MLLTKFAFRALLAAIALSGAVSQAAIVVTPLALTNGTDFLTPTFPVSNTDLINGLAPSASTGNFNVESSGGLPVLTDGTFPAIVSRNDVTPAFPAFQLGSFADGGPNGGTSVTYTLPSTSNIASIVVTGGWQDGGRDQQGYTVLYSTAADPTNFVSLATVDYNPSDPGAHPQVTQVTILDNAGLLATNVAAVRFNFNAVENNHTGYGEIDVIGVPVPEPSTLALAGAGALGLVVAARRRRSV